MASNTVKVTLLADAKGFQKGMKEAEGATTGFEKKSSTFAKAVQGFFALQAVQAIGQFVGESIQEFSKLEQSIGSVESVFGESADQITESARRAADEFGLSASDFNQSAALIGSQLKNQLGLSAEEAAGKTDELIGKASDLAATFGGTTSDAISAISGLMRGERDAIEKYGVSMNDAAVQAKVLEMGLADSTSEITAQDKATASLQILFDQTADSAGQFAEESDTLAGKEQRLNAEMANQKALLGQSLVPLHLTWLGILKNITPELGNVALGLAEVTGAMTATETAIREWENEAGRAAETSADWLEALGNDVNQGKFREWLGGVATMTDEFTNKIIDGIDEWTLGSEELGNLTGQLEALYNQGKISKEQLDLFTGAIETKTEALAQANLEAQRGRGREEEYAAALRGTEGATDDLTGATDDATTALREQFDLIDGRLDAFGNLTDATNDQAEAQQAVNDAIAEYGEGSPEHIAAVEDLMDANRDLKDAEIGVVEAGGMTREEFIKQQIELGATYAEAKLLADKYNELFTPREVTHRIHFDESRRQTGHSYAGTQHGGPVQFDVPRIVGEAGPEVFVPNSAGRIIPNHKLGGGAPGMAVNITINAGLGSDPNAISRAVVEALQRYQRHNGAIPIRTVG